MGLPESKRNCARLFTDCSRWPQGGLPKTAAHLAKDHTPNLPPAPAGGVRLRGLAGLSEFVERAAPELAANAMLCAVNQAAYLLKHQLESQGQTFVESGGVHGKALRSTEPGEKV